jgi:hypothetical protein
LGGLLKLRNTGTLYADLEPGAQFTLDFSARNTANLIFRVLESSVPDPARPEFEITFTADRGYLYT